MKKMAEIDDLNVNNTGDNSGSDNAKRFSESIIEMIKDKFSSLKLKKVFNTFSEFLSNLKTRSRFDASLNAYEVGMVLVFDTTVMKFGIADVGRNGSATLLVPKGHVLNGKIVIDGVFQVYLSTLGKTIRVTEQDGEPKIDQSTGSQLVIDGRGNAIWEACNKASDDAGIISVVADKAIIVKQILRGFGPSGYVDKGGTMTPTSHKLTTLPLFEEIEWK